MLPENNDDLTDDAGDDWMCAVCLYHGDNRSDDHILQYSTGMVFDGLLHEARRDAVRENDGDRMISHWKMELPELPANRHYKYCIVTHHLIAGKFYKLMFDKLYVANLCICIVINYIYALH